MAVLLGFARAGAVVTRRAADAPLLPARILAILWTAGAALGAFLLVRRRSGIALALVAVALLLAAREANVLHDVERAIALAMKETGGDRAATAERLGISASTLARRIRSAADSEG